MSASPSLSREWSGPDTIAVSTSYQIELPATRANLNVNVRGTSYFSGDAALTKAREVGQLVSELTRLGIPEAAIHLKGVTADAATGVLGKTSSVNYELTIRCDDVNKIADAVGIIASQKNTLLRGIAWEYDAEDEAQKACLLKCVEKANERARLIATGLGVRLIGVLNCADSFSQAVGVSPMAFQSPARDSVSRAYAPPPPTSADFGAEFSQTKTIQVSVSVTYRISDFDSA